MVTTVTTMVTASKAATTASTRGVRKDANRGIGTTRRLVTSACSAAMVRDRSNGSGNPEPGSNATSKLRLNISSAIDPDLRNSHRRAQSLQRAIDPGLDPRWRYAQGDSHVGQRHVEMKVEKDGDALVMWQAQHRPTQVFALEPGLFPERLPKIGVG